MAPIYGNTELPYASADDQHHYFVLDPDVMEDKPPSSPGPSLHDTIAVNSATVDSDPGLRFPTPPPPLLEATLPGASRTAGKSTVATRRQSPDGKERDEARDVGVDDELSKNHRGRSIHEIPLRPARDGHDASAAVAVGGPVCDDSGVDMGTSSWP